MYLDKQWRVITVGDGDLSFSRSLVEHHNMSCVGATTFDSKTTLLRHYVDDHLTYLLDKGVPVYHEVDVMRPDRFPDALLRGADLVIFQFPLLPVNENAAAFSRVAVSGDTNLAHRWLLNRFLHNAHRYLLDPDGAGVCMITSKDVKPYSDWNLQGSVAQHTNMFFLGTSAFKPQTFPPYKIQNVSRDSAVKSTRAITYVWASSASLALRRKLQPADRQGQSTCDLCGVGPFHRSDDMLAHQVSKRHKRLVKYEHNWQTFFNKNALD